MCFGSMIECEMIYYGSVTCAVWVTGDVQMPMQVGRSLTILENLSRRSQANLENLWKGILETS